MLTDKKPGLGGRVLRWAVRVSQIDEDAIPQLWMALATPVRAASNWLAPSPMMARTASRSLGLVRRRCCEAGTSPPAYWVRNFDSDFLPVQHA